MYAVHPNTLTLYLRQSKTKSQSSQLSDNEWPRAHLNSLNHDYICDLSLLLIGEAKPVVITSVTPLCCDLYLDMLLGSECDAMQPI